MRTISTILVVVALGCAKDSPPAQDRPQAQNPSPTQNPSPEQENQMSQNTQSRGSDDEPTITTLSLTRAVPAEEMPPFLQERIKRTPPTITVADVRALQPEERDRVLAVVERALQYHLAAAKNYRNLGNPSELIAKDLAMFLNAARQ